MRVTLTILGALVLAAPAQAQSFDFAHVDVQVLLPSGPREPEPGAEDAELTVYSVNTAFLLPIALSANFSLLAGARYSFLGPHATNASAIETRDFHEVGITLGAVGNINAQWRLSGLVSPSLASDFRDLDGDAINVRALLLASVRLHDRFTFEFGGFAAYQLGRLVPLPVLGFEWKPTDGDLFAVRLPLSLRYAHSFGDRLQLGIDARLGGNRHAVSGDRLRSLQTTNLDVGARAAVRLFDGLWLEAYGGAVLFRNFNISDGSEDTLFNTPFNPGGVLQLSVTFAPAPGTVRTRN